MSENYPLFKEYLQQALRIIEDRAGTRQTQGATGQQEEKGIIDKAREKLS